MITMAYGVLGFVAGIASGLLGIGGGTVAVPVLVLLFGMTQQRAQGTILAAFLPPVAFLAFLEYYQSGNVDLKAAVLLAAGIFLGAYFGAGMALSIEESVLRKLFGVFLIFVAARLILWK